MPSPSLPSSNPLTRETLALARTNLERGLVLKGANKKSFKLTAAHLETWFAQAECSLLGSKHELSPKNKTAQIHRLSTQFLSHFGLQSPQAVIDFLNSPAGKITTALVGKQLTEMMAIEEHVQENLLAAHLMKRRRLSFLLAGLLHRREMRIHRLNEEAQLANDKRHRAEETEAIQKRLASSSDKEIQEAYLEITLAAYTEASNETERLLDNKILASKTCEDALVALELRRAFSATKYKHYNTHLALAYDDLAQWALLPTLTVSDVQQKIQILTKQLNATVDEIQNLLEEGKDKEDMFHEKMAISNAQNLHIAMLMDMISVIEGRKFLYTQNGIRTQNFNEAEFIIAAEKKIVFKDSKYYLLNADKDIENLSHEDKQAGEEAYLRYRPEIMGVKPLVKHHQQVEQDEHSKSHALLSSSNDTIQQEILLLANQLTQIQAARANIETSLIAAPTPTMTASPNTTTKGLSTSYSHMLLSMKPTKRSIDWLKTNIDKIAEPKLKAEVNKLTPGKPIPPTLLTQLLARRDLGLLWLNPSKPDIAKTDLTPYAATPARTTPFSVIPNPFRRT